MSNHALFDNGTKKVRQDTKSHKHPSMIGYCEIAWSHMSNYPLFDNETKGVAESENAWL